MAGVSKRKHCSIREFGFNDVISPWNVQKILDESFFYKIFFYLTDFLRRHLERNHYSFKLCGHYLDFFFFFFLSKSFGSNFYFFTYEITRLTSLILIPCLPGIFMGYSNYHVQLYKGCKYYYTPHVKGEVMCQERSFPYEFSVYCIG
jgi:hypothetical protein